MSWLLVADNGSWREFDNRADAEINKAELEGIGLNVEVIPKEDSEEPATSQDTEPQTPQTVGGRRRRCPACGDISEKVYRCTVCGKDLADATRGVGTGGERQ